MDAEMEMLLLAAVFAAAWIGITWFFFGRPRK